MDSALRLRQSLKSATAGGFQQHTLLASGFLLKGDVIGTSEIFMGATVHALLHMYFSLPIQAQLLPRSYGPFFLRINLKEGGLWTKLVFTAAVSFGAELLLHYPFPSPLSILNFLVFGYPLSLVMTAYLVV